MREFLKPSLTWLFVFVPLAIALEKGGALSPPLIFFAASSAIRP